MSYVVAAWVATVLLLGGYAYSVHRRRAEVEREIRRLRAELGDGAVALPSSPSPRDAAPDAGHAPSAAPPEPTPPEPASPEPAPPEPSHSDPPPSDSPPSDSPPS